MNTLLSELIIKTILRPKRKGRQKKEEHYSSFALAKGFREFKITAFRYVKDFILITVGIFSAAFGFKGFLLTNHFIDGGATGISLLVSALTPVPLSILIVCINVPFIILGYHVINKVFAIKMILAISGLALVLATVDFPDVTKDNLLVAVFGGFFLARVLGFQ